MRVALIQLNSGEDPRQNLVQTTELIEQAVAERAEFVLTPEVTNVVSRDIELVQSIAKPESRDETLSSLCSLAQKHKLWLLIGSLAMASDDERALVNRSFFVDPNGKIRARYDKIHMFDVALPGGERFHESASYRAGSRAVLAHAGFGKVGLTICYDLRFPVLFQRLARAGASILTVPSAFTVPTGTAHWLPLLQARAIENGAFVLAPAQTGSHPSATKAPRETYGHSAIIDPWGEVVALAGTDPCVLSADIDLDRVAQARSTIPSLSQEAAITGP